MALHVPYNQRALHTSCDNNSRTTRFSSVTPGIIRSIPRPVIFSQLWKPTAENLVPGVHIPNVSECAVHLELLHALYALRGKVMNSKNLDIAFDIKAQPRTVWRGRRHHRYQVKIRDSSFARRRETKWPIFLKFAVLRFLQWVKKADADLSQAESNDQRKEISLPPLDILMVWHSCLLNPKDFQQFCLQNSYKHIREVEFPWEQIHGVINQQNWAFNLSTGDNERFKAFTGLDSDLYDSLSKPGSNTAISRDILTHCLQAKLSPEELGNMVKSLKSLSFGSAEYFAKCFGTTNQSLQTTMTMMEAAVSRQESFVNKMEKFLWIRSPAVAGTLERAVDRYSRFLKLFKLYPNQMLVPTLDIDLVWHTHQCSASRYQADMESYAGRFVDHDDKVGTSTLDDGMGHTSELYRIRFGRDYSICLCWDCEAALSVGEKISKGGDINHREKVKEEAKRVMQLVTFYKNYERSRRDDKVPRPRWDEVNGECWC